MVLKDFKIKAIERFIEMFNAEDVIVGNGNVVNINGVEHFNTKKLELDLESNVVLVRRYVRNFNIISAGIAIDDINSMFYFNTSYETISLDNIKL